MKRVTINSLRPGMVVEEDIFTPQNNIVPLIRKNTIVSKEMLGKLWGRDIMDVFIQDPSLMRNKPPPRVIRPSDDIYIPDPPKPVIDEALQTDALDNLEELFSASTIAEEDMHDSTVRIIKNLDVVVEQLVDSLGKDHNTLVNINDLKSYDEYTYHHSLSVAILSIAIAQYTGFDKENLNRLGKAAMMHDIGKTAVPIEVIHKKSKLSDEEFAVIKRHSTSGYEYLTERKIGDPNIWYGVLHHHEKVDGTGYPFGLKGDEIPLWSRIISAADVYDALTSNRPYREPMQPAEAVEYIMAGVGSSFDFDIVESFTKRVELYPVGSVVELSDGQQAVVIDNYNHFRPIVTLLDSGKIVDLCNDRAFLNLVINRIVSKDEIIIERG